MMNEKELSDTEVRAFLQKCLDAFDELRQMPDLAAKVEPEELELLEYRIAEMAETFQADFNMECPTSMRPGLLLPDLIFVTWRSEQGISGEVQLSNVVDSMDRQLDASLLDRTVNGHKLGEMRIADAMTDMAGPFYTLFEIAGGQISGELFIFDLRELYRLDLSYSEYLEMAALTRGVVFWQYLFCNRNLILTRAEKLAKELDFLAARFPSPQIEMLKQRLAERTDNG